MAGRASRKARVLKRLEEAAGAGGDGFVCSRSLGHPQVGGRRLAARIAELRADGAEIETKVPCRCQQCMHAWENSMRANEPPSRLAAYRLAADREVSRA